MQWLIEEVIGRERGDTCRANLESGPLYSSAVRDVPDSGSGSEQGVRIGQGPCPASVVVVIAIAIAYRLSPSAYLFDEWEVYEYGWYYHGAALLGVSGV